MGNIYLSKYNLTYKQAKHFVESSETYSEAAQKAGCTTTWIRTIYERGPKDIYESIEHCKILQLLTTKPMRLKSENKQ